MAGFKFSGFPFSMRPGVEDLTGGVTSCIPTNKVLSKERLWKELLNENQDFIFGCSSPDSFGDGTNERKGLALNHAYSIRRAVEAEGKDGKRVRLLLIRNPWGKRSAKGMGVWNGAWSDGSKEWTPYWMERLDHRFGDNGEFWMSFDDVLKHFTYLDRTRLFNADWNVIQKWASVNVSWFSGYLRTFFLIEVKEKGPIVVVLSQVRNQTTIHDIISNFTNPDSSTPATSKVSKDNISSISISYYEPKMRHRIKSSSERVNPGEQISDLSLRRLSSRRAFTRSFPRLWPRKTTVISRLRKWSRNGQRRTRKR